MMDDFARRIRALGKACPVCGRHFDPQYLGAHIEEAHPTFDVKKLTKGDDE